MATILVLIFISAVAMACILLQKERHFDIPGSKPIPPQQKKTYVRVLDNNIRGKNTVIPDNTPLHVKRGWEQHGNTYRGYYRTRYGAWRGEIRKVGDIFKVLIFKPPIDQLEKHSRYACIREVSNGKYRIDLHKNPKDKDIGAIIFYVENLIVQSYQMT